MTEHTSHALAVLLEVRAKGGLHRFEEAGLALEKRVPYPVLRVLWLFDGRR